MANTVRGLIVAIGFAAGVSSFATVAAAAPGTGALAIKNAVPTNVESVQWRRGWGGGWRGGGWGYRGGGGWGGAGAAFVAGAVIGSSIASPYYYNYPPYYPGPYYVAPPAPVIYGPPAPVYSAPVVADDDAYCSQRFKSYDPRTGTYLGYDGLRHPCP
jgi:BA14K-like protein